MKKIALPLTAAVAAIALSACNPPSPAVITAAKTGCSVVETALGIASILHLTAIENHALDAAAAICEATGGGANLTPQTDVDAIIAAVQMLEPYLVNLHSPKAKHMKADIAKLHGMAHAAGM